MRNTEAPGEGRPCPSHSAKSWEARVPQSPATDRSEQQTRVREPMDKWMVRCQGQTRSEVVLYLPRESPWDQRVPVRSVWTPGAHGLSPLSHLPWLPRWLSDKESACRQWKHGFDPWVGKIPWRRKWQPNSNIFAWRIPWTKEPGRLQSMGSQRVNTTERLNHNPFFPPAPSTKPSGPPEFFRLQNALRNSILLRVAARRQPTWQLLGAPGAAEARGQM